MMRLVCMVLVALALPLSPPAEAATRTYARPVDQPIIHEQLQRALDVALSRKGTTVAVGSTTVIVTHPTLGPADDAAVNAVLSAYIYDPLYNAGPEARNLAGKIQILRQWASDARDEVLAWDAQTQAQKNAAMKITIDRLGKFFDNMADLLKAEGLDN